MVAELKRQRRASPVLHGDETGWREAGRNGYLRGFSSAGPEGVRYSDYDPGRGGEVVERLPGEDFHGHLVSDFYGAYNRYPGPHQRGWVHRLRDLHELQEAPPDNPEGLARAQQVRTRYEAAQQFLASPDPPGREARAPVGRAGGAE